MLCTSCDELSKLSHTLSHSHTYLAQEDGLRVLLDELLAIAQGASEEWPEVGMLRDVCRALQQLLDEEAAAEASQLRALAGGGREAAEEEVGEQEEAGTRGGAGGSSLNSGDVLGELVSPVRRALAGVGLKSPGTHTHTHGNALDELVSPVRRALAGVGLKSPGPSASAASGSAADAAADGTAGGSVGRFFPAIGGGSGNAGGKPPLPRGPNTVLTAAGKKAERKAAMLTAGRAGAGGSGADEGAGARAVTAAAAAAAAPRPAALSDRAGELLGSCLRTLLGACPFALPGSATFAYSDPVHSMEAALAFAPRAAVHEALLRPHTFLGGEEVPYGPRLEDAALAYRLLLGSDSLDVPHWFAEFCAANGVGRGGDGDGAGGSGDVEVDEALAGESNRCGGRRKGGRGRRTGMHAVVNSPNGKRGKRGGGAGGGDDAGGADCAAKVFSRLSDEQQEEAALTLAAYFSQAVSELTFVGMCRPSKRRKGAAVQRLYYPPETLI
ncbi:hypothetical protein FOA52_014765 [Chlamydomonas sp. UWO 241]|nr:hypothetical protein FOA52_014765 [Chlamydomonas sp. UWO 241]